MKFQATLLAALLAVTASAGGLSRRSVGILERQSSGCGSYYIACGDGCIDSTWTCCPDQQGGCPSDENCQKGDNGEYGCCPLGETCSGDGGVDTTIIGGGDGGFGSTTSFSFGASTASSRATTTSNAGQEGSASSTTRSTSRSTSTAAASSSSSGSSGNSAASHTYGSFSSTLLYGGSLGAAGLTLLAAIML